MILAVCVDNAFGMMFGKRRQSKDAALREHLLALSGGRLRMSAYSAKQFEQAVYSEPDYLSGAQDGDWCFVENGDYEAYTDRIEQIVLFRWNRDYPADLHFHFPGQWQLISREDFPGKSHETITMEVYKNDHNG